MLKLFLLFLFYVFEKINTFPLQKRIPDCCIYIESKKHSEESQNDYSSGPRQQLD